MVGKSKGNRTQVMGYYEPEAIERLKALSAATGLPQTVHLREALDDLLEKYATRLRKNSSRWKSSQAQHPYKPPPPWKEPTFAKPSDAYPGEKTTAPIHAAVGRATGAWEHMESGFAKLYQVLCETKSLAASRGYGTAESVYARSLLLKYAAAEFFRQREAADQAPVRKLVIIYGETGEIRNRIAHGVAIQPHAYGYFLCPAPHASRRRSTPYPDGLWGLGADYYYRAAEIDYCKDRFEQLLAAAMSMMLYLNSKYGVLAFGDIQP